MKRTTIYLDPELEILLKLEAMRRKQPMAEVIREALREKLSSQPRPRSRYVGAPLRQARKIISARARYSTKQKEVCCVPGCEQTRELA